MVLATALAVVLMAIAGRDGTVAERAAAGAPSLEPSREQVLDAHAKLPLAFVPNRGQTDARVRYYAQGSRHGFYFTRKGLALSFVNRSERHGPDGVSLALRFLGANPRVVPRGEERMPGKVNSLVGGDPARWRTGLPRFARIVYRELWPGVDMVLRGRDGELKYEFRVRPGARPANIRLAYRGAESVARDGAGGLSIKTALGVLRDSPPVAYQEIDGVRVPVHSRYVLKGRSYGFAVGAHDPDHELIVDPGLAYSTFLGGSSHESGDAIAVDASGNAYVTGLTQSPNFPTTPGAFDRTGAAGNNLDVFVSKLNATGTALVYSTFIGGGNFDWGRGLAVDGAGNAYVTGQTKSSNFPTTGGAFDRTFNIDNCPRCGIDQYDAFVAKLNASGSRLVYSTFLGGTDFDDSFGIALDGAANAYVTGQTGSRNFPTTAGGFDTTANGSYDGFVTKLNGTGSGLVYSTRLGGAENELPENVAVDGAGNAYVGGSTRSADFPTTPGAFDTTHNGGALDELFDLFATKLNPSGSALVYSTFLGGSKSDFGEDLAVDAAGNAYLTGVTLSPDFPTTAGSFDPVFAGGSEGFAAKLNAPGSALVYSTFLGEAGGSAVAPDAGGNAWVAGATGSPTAATTPDAFDREFNGGASDAYVAKLNATGSALLHATFLGGADSEGAGEVALDSGGNVYVTGHTCSADFPTTPGAFDVLWGGDPFIFWGDAFVTKLAVGGASPPPPAASLSSLSVNPSSVVGGNASTGTVTLSSAAPAGGALVSLSSSNAGVASVPANVTVAAGATSGTFTVGTTTVAAATQVTITAVYDGGTRTATLTVGPASSAPLPAPSLLSPANDARFPPGASVAFDWSDAAGAATYTIQIDDTESFSAPLIAGETVGVSEFTADTLPTRRMWWRVRANDGAGAPGTWSGVRRFELKD